MHFTGARNFAEPQATRPRSQALRIGTVEKARERAYSLLKMGSVALRATKQGEDVIGYPPHVLGVRIPPWACRHLK